jgi:asparagine synthetase B (glutamine-hydrolysing)
MKVMLDGQGADEILGGYETYLTVIGSNLLDAEWLRPVGRERAVRLAGYQPEALASPSLGRLRPSAELAASVLATTSSTIGWLFSAHSS